MRIFPQHTHIDGIQELMLTLKPNKTTLRNNYTTWTLPTGLIDKWKLLALLCCWCWFDVMPHHQSVVDTLDESQLNLTQKAVVRFGNTAATGLSTHREWPKELHLSVRACQHDWGPAVCDWWPGFCIFLKLTRAGSVGWKLSLLYLVYIILIISLTNPAVSNSRVHVCAHVHTLGGVFPCPQLSRYV